ncbi:MAG: glutamyl-tRNA reductase [Acidimicrobiales bacterium]|nr:glutamyl-tRNA reductase [Actinomycetota bacterium]
MSVVVVGLNHRTVPLDLLERLAVPRDRLPKALGDLMSRPFVSEAVILSTCHRTEVYAVAERFHGAMQDVRHFLSEMAFIPPEDFSDHLYAYNDDAAAAHLFAVSAGLDSLVLGESQILGQVREAWTAARDEGAAGSRLSALFRHALEVGKRSRAETGIGRGITSLSQAAVAMARQRLGTLAGRSILVVGAGKMGERVVADLAGGQGAEEVLIANRTWDRAVALASRVGGRAVQLEGLGEALADADVAFTSSAGADVLIEQEMLAPVMAARPDRPLLVVDLGMPRNVDPGVRDVPGVTLLDLSDLQEFARAGLDQRRKEAVPVRSIVAQEVGRYIDATTARGMAPTVSALRERGERLRAAELERFRSRLSGLDARQREAVEAMTKGIVAKLLHDPTVRVKDAAGSARGERLADALRELFDL